MGRRAAGTTRRVSVIAVVIRGCTRMAPLGWVPCPLRLDSTMRPRMTREVADVYETYVLVIYADFSLRSRYFLNVSALYCARKYISILIYIPLLFAVVNDLMVTHLSS